MLYYQDFFNKKKYKDNFHLKRYLKFINQIKKLNRILDEYTEEHHIVPKCMTGSNIRENLITLRLREHYLAHVMLARAFPKNYSLASALLQMQNKNPKSKFKPKYNYNSHLYASLKTKAYELHSQIMSGFVFAINQNGDRVRISSEEYSNGDYTFHTKGKVVVFDKIENKFVSIPTEIYYLDKKDSNSRYQISSSNSSIDIKKVKFKFIDKDTNEIIKLTKIEAKNLNLVFGYKKYKQLQKKTLNVFFEGQIITISLEDYNPLIHTHIFKGLFVVIDNYGNIVRVTKEQYNKEKENKGYKTNSEGKVIARNIETGKCNTISKEEYENNSKYTGTTKDKTTVFDKETKEFVTIDVNEYNSNKDRYNGPCLGKLNIIDKISGQRKQINKIDWNQSEQIALCNQKYYFKVFDKKRSRETKLHIFDLKHIDFLIDRYEILDTEKFNKLKVLL